MNERLFEAIGSIDDKYIAEQAQWFSQQEGRPSGRPRRMNSPAFRRLACAACAAVMIFSLTMGAVFAGPIRTYIRTVLSGERGAVDISDITAVSISDSAIISDEGIAMTVTDAEAMLGVDILTTNRAASDILYYSTKTSDGNITRVDLYYPDFIDYTSDNEGIDEAAANAKDDAQYQEIENTRKWIVMSVSFITQYAGEDHIEAFREGIDAAGGKDAAERYTLEAIGADAVVYTYDWSPTRLNAAFVYRGMLYTVWSNNVPLEEMIDLLRSLK